MKKFIISSLLLSLIFSNAQASNTNNNEKFYIGGEAGLTNISEKSKDYVENIENIQSINTKIDKKIYDLRIFGGYNFNKHINIELGVSETSKRNASSDFDLNIPTRDIFNRPINVSGKGTVKSSLSHLVLDYSLLIRPFEEKYLNNLFLRVGGIYYKAKYSDNTSIKTYGTNYSYSSSSSSVYSGTGFALGFGYDINLTDSVNARISFTHIKTQSGDYAENWNRLSVGVVKNF